MLTDAERKEMCDIHFGMVEVVVDEFLSRERNRKYKPHREDFLGEGYIQLVKSSEKFDDQRGFQFRTYASNSIRYAMLKLFKIIEKKESQEVYIEDLVGTNREPRVYQNKYDELGEEFSQTPRWIIKLLEPTIPLYKKVFYEILLGGRTCRELASYTDRDPREIHIVKTRLLKTIRKKLDKKGITYEDFRKSILHLHQ